VTGPLFFPEALAEYEDAVVYYELRDAGLGDRFVHEFDDAAALLMEFPQAAPAVAEASARYGLRWTLLRSFPIKVVYTVREDALVVVAVFHARRRPGYWLERLERLR
jgi:plasmid stabilization system protein ParE